jgi:uncharacterized membrane protein YhaH (DUF805 family)
MLAGELAGSVGNALLAMAFVWSACALSAQRLRDVGRSSWWLLAFFVPVLGPLWLLIQLLKRGVEGPNRYGDDPSARDGYLVVDISQ